MILNIFKMCIAMWIFTRDFSSPSTSKVGKKTNVQITFFIIRNDFAPKRLSVPRLESKPAPEQTLQKWRLPSKKSKTDPVQALQCNAWEPRQAQNSDPTQEERSLKGTCHLRFSGFRPLRGYPPPYPLNGKSV